MPGQQSLRPPAGESASARDIILETVPFRGSIPIDTKRDGITSPTLPGDKLVLSEEEFARNWQAGNERGLSIVLVVDPTEKLHQHNEGEDMRRTRSAETAHRFGETAPPVLRHCEPSHTCDRSVCRHMHAKFIFRSTIDDGIQGRNINLVWLLVMGQFFVFVGNYVANSISDILLTKLGLKNKLRHDERLPQQDSRSSDELFRLQGQLRPDSENRRPEPAEGYPHRHARHVGVHCAEFSGILGILIYFEARIYAIFLFVSALTLMLWSVYFKNRRREIDYANFEYSSENRNNLYELVNERNGGNQSPQRAELAGGQMADPPDQNQRTHGEISFSKPHAKQAAEALSFQPADGHCHNRMCATFVVRGDMTIGVMMTVNYLIGRLSVPLRNIYTSVNVIQDASISYERLDSIVNYETEERNPHPDTPLPATSSFFQCQFQISRQLLAPCAQKLNCTPSLWERPQPSWGQAAAEKRLWLKLLLGFYKPTAGTVTVDGLDISTIDTNDWLKSFGVVTVGLYFQ